MKCFGCGREIDRNMEERRFEGQKYLYGVFTYFGSDNDSCEVERRTKYLCENCSYSVGHTLEEIQKRWKEIKELKNEFEKLEEDYPFLKE